MVQLKYTRKWRRRILAFFMLMCWLACLQNMWDLTPPTELLQELPAEYSTESALADLVVSFLVRIFCLLSFIGDHLWRSDLRCLFLSSGQLITGFVVKWWQTKKVNQVSSHLSPSQLTIMASDGSNPCWVVSLSIPLWTCLCLCFPHNPLLN